MRLTLRITTLHDKLLDNTVEKHTLILVRLAKLDESYPGEEAYRRICRTVTSSHRRLDFHIYGFIRVQRLIPTSYQREQEHGTARKFVVSYLFYLSD